MKSLRNIVSAGVVVAALFASAGPVHAGATNGTTTISGPSTLAVKANGAFKVVLTCPTKITTGKIYLTDRTDAMNPKLLSAALISGLTPASGFSGGFMYTANFTYAFTSMGTYVLSGTSAGTGTCASSASSPLTVKVTLGTITSPTLKPGSGSTTTVAGSGSSGSSGESTSETVVPTPDSTTAPSSGSSDGSANAAGSSQSTVAVGDDGSGAGDGSPSGESAEGDEADVGAEEKTATSDMNSDDSGSSSTGLIVGIVGLAALAGLFLVLAKKRKKDESAA